MDRRKFLALGAAALPLIKASSAAALEDGAWSGHGPPQRSFPGGQPAVITPNGTTLPWRIVNGVKVGHLIAGPCTNAFTPLLSGDVWGYNGSTPGPTIEAVEGDHVRIYVTNRLPEPTTVHWHGVILPNGMDGVSGLSQAPIPPGETYMYEFTFREPGTHMYHSHFDEMTQMAMGLVGMMVVHPKAPHGPRVDRDFVMMTHEWRIDVGSRKPNPMEMTDFNVLTFNGKAFPGCEPLLVGLHERVRIRLGNLSAMDHHPIHIHGLHFKVTATDGGFVEPSAQWPENTVIVPVGACRVIEMVPTVAGDWAMHCHMTHHTMLQMGHDFPNMVGVDTTALDKRMSRVLPDYMAMGTNGMGGMAEMGMDVPKNSASMKGGPGPFGVIDMGGMFTILKVREKPDQADPNGWYANPPGSVAVKADEARMQADGIKVDV